MTKNLESPDLPVGAEQPDEKVLKAWHEGNEEFIGVMVPVESIINKAQVREIFEGIDELAASIKQEGLQSPIIVSKPNDQGLYEIQKGERRWLACKRAGLTVVPVIVKEKPENIVDEIVGEITENIQRSNLKPLELAKAIGKLIDTGLTSKQIAEKFCKPTSYISRHKKLLELQDEVFNLYDRDIVTDPDTLNALRSLYDLDKKFCKKYIKQIIENNGVMRVEAQKTYRQHKLTLEKKPSNLESSSSGTNQELTTNDSIVLTDNKSNDSSERPSSDITSDLSVDKTSDDKDQITLFPEQNLDKNEYSTRVEVLSSEVNDEQSDSNSKIEAPRVFVDFVSDHTSIASGEIVGQSHKNNYSAVINVSKHDNVLLEKPYVKEVPYNDLTVIFVK